MRESWSTDPNDTELGHGTYRLTVCGSLLRKLVLSRGVVLVFWHK